MTAPWPPVDEALTEPERAENARLYAEGQRQKAEQAKIAAAGLIPGPLPAGDRCDPYFPGTVQTRDRIA